MRYWYDAEWCRVSSFLSWHFIVTCKQVRSRVLRAGTGAWKADQRLGQQLHSRGFASQIHQKSRLLLDQKQIHWMRRNNFVRAILVYVCLCELCLKYVSMCDIVCTNECNVWNAAMGDKWVPLGQGMLSPRSAEFARFGKRSSIRDQRNHKSFFSNRDLADTTETCLET